jgi:hypothetical protein
MTDRPILFSGAMVRALLDGHKMQTRRLATSKPMQRVQVGDRLWVREAWLKVPATAYRCSEGVAQALNPANSDEAAIYATGWDRSIPHWRPSIHMPRWASRLTLTVTETRTQPLIWIDRADAMAEGCPFPNMATGPDPRFWYATLWNSLHTNPGEQWNDNPDVIALTFTVEHRNIDA